MRRFPEFLLFLFLTGCATLSQQDCSRGDWFGLGINDGRAGESSNRLTEHIKACAEYGIAINDQSYFAGREQGLRDYCQLDNAFRTGLNGQAYHHVCPQSIDAVFSRYHSVAFAVHQDRSSLEQIDNTLSDKESDLRDKKQSDKDRARLREDIRRLDRQRDRLLDDLYYHERQLDDLRREAQYDR